MSRLPPEPHARPAPSRALPVLVLYLGAAAFSALGPAPARAGDDVDPAAGNPVRGSQPPSTSDAAGIELSKIQADLRALEERNQRDRRSLQTRLRELGAEKKAAERGTNALREGVEKRRKELAEKKDKLAKIEADLEVETRMTAAILARLKEHLDALERDIRAGIPWLLDTRVETLSQMRTLLDAAGTDPASAMAAVGRLHQEEEALGRLVETGTVEVPTESGPVAVNAFHLGSIAVLFANDDGSVIGLVKQGETLADGLAAARENAAAAAGYLVAVDILRRRRTPGIVDLYLPALPVKSEGGR